MGNNQSTSWQRPLRCILDNWKLFNPLAVRRSHLKFFCATVWPQYPPGDEEHWPEDGTLNYNTILQLELFCKRQGKWTEIPYVQKYGIVVRPKSEPTRQMVLGTGNQEKEPPREGSRVAWCSFLVPKRAPISGSTSSTKASSSMSFS